MLYRHIETPELSMRFKWTSNLVAFWDNCCTQHHALWDYYPHRRYGYRVTVCGQKPALISRVCGGNLVLVRYKSFFR